MSAVVNYIGTIHTPYKTLAACPSNINVYDSVCQIEIQETYQSAIKGLNVGDLILVLYWLDKAQRNYLEFNVGTEQIKGVFSLRSPHRPNPIGAAVVSIKSIDETTIKIQGMDCLDGTPLLDLKPAIYLER